MNHFLFRADAGPGIGIGHLRRTLSVAQALRGLGLESAFLGNEAGGTEAYVSASGFSGASLGEAPSWGREDLDTTVQRAKDEGVGVVVVDSHREGADYLQRLRDAGLRVVAITDNAEHAYPCDLLVNTNVHALDQTYETARDTVRLMGAQYAVLTPAYWQAQPRPANGQVGRILLTTGGSDPLDLLPRLLEKLLPMRLDASLAAIVGPFAGNRERLEELAAAGGEQVKLIIGVTSLYPCIAAADLAVSAGGQTLYEFACLGCPTVAFCLADNQEGQMTALAAAGAIRHLGPAQAPDLLDRVALELQTLITDDHARSRMAAAGPRIVDGQGAPRLALALAEQVQ